MHTAQYDGMIAMTSEDGETILIKAGPKHEIVRINTDTRPLALQVALVIPIGLNKCCLSASSNGTPVVRDTIALDAS